MVRSALSRQAHGKWRGVRLKRSDGGAPHLADAGQCAGDESRQWPLSGVAGQRPRSLRTGPHHRRLRPCGAAAGLLRHRDREGAGDLCFARTSAGWDDAGRYTARHRLGVARRAGRSGRDGRPYPCAGRNRRSGADACLAASPSAASVSRDRRPAHRPGHPGASSCSYAHVCPGGRIQHSLQCGAAEGSARVCRKPFHFFNRQKGTAAL